MTTVVTKISTGATKFQVGVATAAVAAAAVLTPAAIAHARPDLIPASPVTNMLSTDLFGTDPILGPVQIPQDSPWWWVGNGSNPNAGAANGGAATATAEARTANRAAASTPFFVFEFTPLALIPAFLQPLAGWFLNLIPQFNICLGGLGGVSVGPYGKLTVKLGGC